MIKNVLISTFFSFAFSLTFCNSLPKSTSNDTIEILLIENDTAFYDFLNYEGTIFNFVNINDSIYLRLDWVSGGGDMGYAGIIPTFEFKSTTPEGVYKIVLKYIGHRRNSNPTFDTVYHRFCKCSSIHPEYFSDEKPIRYIFLDDKEYYSGKCFSYFKSGILKEEKTYENGIATLELSYYENEVLKSQKEGENYYSFYTNGQNRFLKHDTIEREYYPNGELKIQRIYNSAKPRTELEFQHWSPEKKLMVHRKIINGKQEYLIKTPEQIIAAYNFPNKYKISSKDTNEVIYCDSILRADSIVSVNGFKHLPDKIVPALWDGEGYKIYYNDNLQKKAEGIFHENKLDDGKYYIYSCGGRFLKILIFENGKYVRDEFKDY
jgi:hypothetical protein